MTLRRMVDHREGVIASSEQQFATPHSPSSHSDRSHLFLGLTETVALISNRFNGLAQITPGLNRSAQSAACVPPCSDGLWKSTRRCRKYRGCSCGV